jgi:hypothetical protein
MYDDGFGDSSVVILYCTFGLQMNGLLGVMGYSYTRVVEQETGGRIEYQEFANII